MAAESQRSGSVCLTMAQALVKYLSVQYSERDGEQKRFVQGIFGIFGHGNVAGLGQALVEYGEDLTYYQARNEQAMVHTAAGFAKANNRTATLACTSSIGPGSTNMLTGAALATINRLPVLLLPADYFATRQQGPVLQQLEHPISADVSVNDSFRPLCRFFDRISRPEQLLTALPEAMRVLTDPVETGAATLSLPQDVQMQSCNYPMNFFEKRVWRIERPLPLPARIDEAVSMLKQAGRPMIIAGGGVHYSQAWEELEAFSREFGIPVAETNAGKGSICRPNPYMLGGVGVTGTSAAGQIQRETDLVISVGTRLSDFTTGSQSAFENPNVKFLSINLSSRDAHKQGALPITADAREALRALSNAAKGAGIKPNPAFLEEVARAKSQWEETLRKEIVQPSPGEPMSQSLAIGILNDEAMPGDTIVAAAGTPAEDLFKLWDVTRGAACRIEFGYSCMTHEIPAGLGVRMAQPKGEVYVFIGDGTYLMHPSELVTSVQEGLKITLVLSENHGFQSIQRLQLNRVGRSFGNEFRLRDAKANRLEGDFVKIDFAKNAESFGARAWRAKTPDEFKKALREARQETRTCAIVVETQKQKFSPPSGVWWDVPVAEVSQDAVTQKLRHEYEEAKNHLQRFHY